MKSPMLLWKLIAEESAIRCHTSATMDIKTVQGRLNKEGFSFLSITLPQFGKDFQKALDQGVVSHAMFQGFSRHGCLPRFLGGFTERVFNRDAGVLLDDPDIDAILAVRQLSLMFSKVLLPCSDARERNSMAEFIECEQEVKRQDSLRTPDDLREFKRMSRLLFSDMFSKIDRMVYNLELVPRHGPGATADKLRGNSKYRQRTWPSRLEPYFPCGDYMFPNARYFAEHYDEVHFLEPGAELPVRVISVPKTMKTPRIIAIEPTAMQYAQQALMEVIVKEVENHPILSSLIGFEQQEPNQLLAKLGSFKEPLATLDLSEASDRVSNQLVIEMMSDFPHLQGAVQASRSTKADVPGHGVIPLSKFASMGSALCFPVEAMVFLTCICLGLEKEYNTQFTSKGSFRALSGRVRVYGDDLIVPVDSVFSVVDSLEHFGARVGASKSFWNGKFRESCGKEYYDGFDVSIVKVRRMLPTTRRDVPEVISMVSLRNQLYMAGYWSTVRWMDQYLVKMLKHFPWVADSSSALGRVSFLGYESQKECVKLHAPLVKAWVVSSRLPIDKLDGPGALLKYFLKRGNLPVSDGNHLERAGRPRSTDIITRWVQPY